MAALIEIRVSSLVTSIDADKRVSSLNTVGGRRPL
jgi:hypothetical protein